MILIDRSVELEKLAVLFDSCVVGEGSVVLVSDMSNCGKTELLNVWSKRLYYRALLLRADGSVGNRRIPLGIVSQLFRDTPPDIARRALELVDSFIAAKSETRQLRIIHDLYALVIELTAERPVVLAVDDVHHADDLSLRFLLDICRRAYSSRLQIVLATRHRAEFTLPAFGEELQGLPHCHHIWLKPLSPKGVESVLTAAGMTAPIAPEWYALSGGNPLLLQALIQHSSPIEPAPTAGVFFCDAVWTCIKRCGPDAVKAARAIAVLDRPDACALVSALGTVNERAVKVLEAAGLVDGGRFRAAEARSTVLAHMSTAEKRAMHHRAAELLLGAGADLADVAGHLVEADTAEPWGVVVLVDAAQDALGRGQPDVALSQLALAERSCKDPRRKASIAALAAGVEWRRDPAAVIPRLSQLATDLRERRLTVHEAMEAIVFLLWHGCLDEVVPGPGSVDDLDLDLHGFDMWVTTTYPGLPPDFFVPGGGEDPATTVPTARRIDATCGSAEALAQLLRSGPDADVTAVAERVLEGQGYNPRVVEPIRLALHTLVYSDDYESAQRWCGRLMERFSDKGAPSWLAMLASIRGEIALRQGDLRAAQAHAQFALARMSRLGWGVQIGEPLGVLMRAAHALGRHDVVAEALSVPVPPTTLLTRAGLGYLHARGQHHLAHGRFQAALGDFLECGWLMTAWNMDLPALIPWRSDAAYVYLRLSQEGRARQLAEEQLDRPGARRSRTHGISLRAYAACAELKHRPELLRDAAGELTEAGDRLELARTFADLGAAHRALGHRDWARVMLRRAQQTASQCGHRGLAIEADPPVPTRDAELVPLSDAENRVAVLAAMGYTNSEIARKLYITVSTVEKHLTQAYRKLNVRGRGDLAVALQHDGPLLTADTAYS